MREWQGESSKEQVVKRKKQEVEKAGAEVKDLIKEKVEV